MNRQEATELVKKFIFKYEQYSLVSADNAKNLLGDKYEFLIKDAIRKASPLQDSFYYWNIIDYLDDNIKLGENK